MLPTFALPNAKEVGVNNTAGPTTPVPVVSHRIRATGGIARDIQVCTVKGRSRIGAEGHLKDTAPVRGNRLVRTSIRERCVTCCIGTYDSDAPHIQGGRASIRQLD